MDAHVFVHVKYMCEFVIRECACILCMSSPPGVGWGGQ